MVFKTMCFCSSTNKPPSESLIVIGKECAVSLPFPFLTGQEAAMAGAGTATLRRRDGSHVLRLAETTSSGCLPLDHYGISLPKKQPAYHQEAARQIQKEGHPVGQQNQLLLLEQGALSLRE
ncbi:hypothetical protein HJG60_008366 [Phyllostomus discolor]|uniref:Uncharacterized protein n=1 Tax=Phyllostomus discolor TaxID=89673 RepID=A0A833Z1F5_9CHIR|nr:hypothetical protein HJG60_008366 [Phyllostomus discolor]